MENSGDDLEQSNEEQPSNFLVLASQSETQYSEWDQQHLLQSLPALKTKPPSNPEEKQRSQALMLGKSDDERQGVKGSVLVEETTEFEVSPYEHDDKDRIENSCSEDESDSPCDVTVVKKMTTSNEDVSDSPVYKSQDGQTSLRESMRDLRSVKNLFPATLSQEDAFNRQEEDKEDRIVATPSEHIGSLHLSGQAVTVPETVEESLDVLAPSPEAYGDIPVIIPSSPTASDDEGEKSIFNPDANRTLESEDLSSKGRQKRDKRERLPPAVTSTEDKPILIEDTVPEEKDEPMVLDPNIKTLACEETQGDSLHLVYSATEAGNSRLPSEEKEMEHRDENSQKEGQEGDVIEDSQDLALHLSQSQGESIHPPGTSSKRRHGVPLSQSAADQAKRSGQSKSSSESNGFHLSVPKDGGLIHPRKDTTTLEDPKDASQQEPRPVVPSVPSLSIAQMESQSQGTSETSFRIEKPELHMTEEGEEAAKEMNVFQKTRVGRQRPVHKQLNLSEDSSEDYFNIEGSRGKEKRVSEGSVDAVPKDNQAKGEDAVPVDEDAETQEHQTGQMKADAEKITEQSEAPHPFDESTETYDVPKSLEVVAEETGQGDTNIASAADKAKEPKEQKRDEDVIESVEPGDDPKKSEVAVTKPQVTNVSSVISDPIPSTSSGITRKQTLTRSPKRRGKSVVASEDVISSKGKTRGYSEKEQNPKKTVPERVDSTSGTHAGKTSRTRNISLPKDSGIGDQLDLTSKSETSPRQGQPPLERIPSDPYVFHGTQSQAQEQTTAKKSPPTTPVSSRKKQKGMHKRTSTKPDSSSSDIKEPVTKPRPKKLKFTKLQRSSGRKSTLTVISSTAPNSSEAVLGPSVGKQGSVSLPSSPGTGFEADISRSVSSQTMLQKHVAFQKPETSAPPLPPQEIVRTPLSDSQLSDQLVESVTVTVEKKTVQRTTTITTVANAEGRIVKHQKQEEYEETPFTTVMFSERKTELPVVSPSRTASSLTPGDLADISSGYSRSASSGKGSLEKSSSSLSLVSPSVHRKDESFTTLLTSSSIQLSQAHGIMSHITSPQVHTQNPLLVSHRVTKTPVLDNTNEGRANTPDESVIEKSDSRIGAVVSSSGERRASESLFTSPDNKKGRKKTSSSSSGQAEEQINSATIKQSSPALRKRAADSSQDSVSDIQSAQRPRMSESGGFSVHGSAYSQQRPRLDAPLNLLVTTDSDIPPSQNRRTTRAEKRKSAEKSSSDDAHMSPKIPLQTTSNTEVSEATDQQCPVVHASKPEIGSKVMAKWKDGFFYPGKILKLEQSGRFYIKFDDGDQMNVKVQHILLVNHIPIGQSVMVMSADGYFDCGMVIGYVGEGENIMYKVSRDEGSTRRYSRSQIILSEDQASCLMSDEEMRVPAALAAGTSSTKLGDVSLDNLVVGERRTRHRTVEEKHDTRKENEESPMKCQESGRVTRKGRSASRSDQKKDKDKEPSSRGKKRKAKEGPMATSTPTPKAKRPAESTVSVAPMTPTTSSMGGAVDSPSESRRHGRKARIGLFEKDKPEAPRSKSPRLFSGMVFLLTHVEKSEEQKQQEKKLLQDSSLETSTEESGIEDEPSVPFDKESLRANIEAAGGVVLDKFNQTQIDAATKAFLISSSFQRTVKYLQCLAAGVPCVSHQWIIHSCSEGKLLDHKAYMLPAGISLERRKLMEWNPCGSCLGGKVVMVLSPNVQFQDAWQSILTISRCKLVNRLPVRGIADAMVDVIIADTTEGSCPLSTQHQAKKLSVPIVTTEWVIQCLINGHTVGYDAHPEYKHNFNK